jgi:hypothetical protein
VSAMALQDLLDFFWITRRRALEMGFTHEGRHMGVPVWCTPLPDSMDVAAKSVLLEWVLDAGGFLLQYANSMREPGDEIPFGFLIRPIEPEA